MAMLRERILVDVPANTSSNDENYLNAKVVLFENVLSETEASECLHECATSLPFETQVDDFGRQSRPTCYFGDKDCVFSYVGLTLEPLPWTPRLLALREKVTATCGLDPSQQELTACLVNYYPPNQGYIPWHYDEVRAHGDSKTVASLSLGGPRRFLLRPQNSTEETQEFWLPSGSVLLMQGPTQELYEHCLPLDEGKAPLRISLTFRSIVPGYEKDRAEAKDMCCTDIPSYAETTNNSR